MVTCEIWIAMNEDGDWVVVDDESAALEQLASDRGGWRARVVKVNVKMTPPKRVETDVTVADETGTVEALPQ